MKKFLTLFAFLAFFACATPETGEPGNELPLPEGTGEFPLSADAAVSGLYDMMNTLYGGTRSADRTVSSIEVYRPGQVSGTRSYISDETGDAYYVINFENEGYSVISAMDSLLEFICITEHGGLTVDEMTEIELRLMNSTPIPMDSLTWISYEEMHYLAYADEDEVPPFDINDYCDDPYDGDDPNEDMGEYILPPLDDDDNDDSFIKEYLVYYLLNEITVEEVGSGDQIEDIPWLPGSLGNGTYYGPWKISDEDKKGPFLTTKWHQYAPFNGKSPAPYGVYRPAGCVTIAVAQITAFNEKKPASTFGVTSTWTGLKNYDPDSYGDITKSTDDLQLEADLAVIVRSMALGMNAHYNYMGSGGTFVWPAQAKKYMKKTLGYGNAKKRTGYKGSVINSMINSGKPVFIGAMDKKMSKGAHAWVIDGSATQTREIEKLSNGYYAGSYFESRSLIHCNFGWDGRSDGYYFSGVFDLNNGPLGMNPGDEGGSSNSNYTRFYRIIEY